MELAGAESSDKQKHSKTAHYGFYYAYIYHIYLFKSINKSFPINWWVFTDKYNTLPQWFGRLYDWHTAND